MRSLTLVAITLAGTILAGALVGPAWGQTDKDQVQAALDQFREALAKGDSDALAGLISDSGFVAALALDTGLRCLDKQGFVTFLKVEAPPAGLGDALRIDDPKIEVHYTVALVNGELTLPGQPPDRKLFADLVLFRELGKWQICALAAGPDEEKPDEKALQDAIARVQALPEAAKQGDMKPLDEALDGDHFLLCFVDPSMELRFVNSKAALMGMIQGILGMVTINQSRFDVAGSRAGSQLAVVDGVWLLDIPDFGQTTSSMRAYAVKTGNEWKIVAIAGGPSA
jgi:ketosteroid isomerase-like protein